MGIYECNHCGEVMCGESFWCEGCHFGYDDGIILCEDCATQGACDKCEKSICVYCVQVGKLPCCGMVLCGGKDGGESTCASKHETSKLEECGHETCNYNDTKTCLQCTKENKKKEENTDIKADKLLIKKLLQRLKSDKGKKLLQSFLSDPTSNKKRKREQNIQELELELKRARNACDACRCGHANCYY